MRALWDALPELARRVRSAGRLALLLDFDGTLAPIAARPEEARLEPATRDRLRELAGCASVRLAVVSGRQMEDLRARVGLPELIYAANHGLEILAGGVSWVHPEAAARQSELRRLCDRVSEQLRRFPAAVVEYKRLTATIHFRGVPARDHARVRDAVHRALAANSPGFLIRPGHKSLEIRPDVAWDKGRAVRLLLARWRIAESFAFCFGDDHTDEDAFAALPGGVTVAVGLKRLKGAKYYVHDPVQVGEFLEWFWVHAPRITVAEAS